MRVNERRSSRSRAGLFFRGDLLGGRVSLSREVVGEGSPLIGQQQSQCDDKHRQQEAQVREELTLQSDEV